MLFWQWINQSFNAIVNYTNRSGDAPITVKWVLPAGAPLVPRCRCLIWLARVCLLGLFLCVCVCSQLGTAYVSATTGAVATALGLNALTKVSTHLASFPDRTQMSRPQPYGCVNMQRRPLCHWGGGGCVINRVVHSYQHSVQRWFFVRLEEPTSAVSARGSSGLHFSEPFYLFHSSSLMSSLNSFAAHLTPDWTICSICRRSCC